MTPPEKWRLSERVSEMWISLLSLGGFLAVAGLIFLITPNLYDEAVAFSKDLKLVEVNSDLSLPAPTSNHPVLYAAVAQFCLGFGIFQIFLLVLRFALRSPLDKMAGTSSWVIFLFGAGFLLTQLKAKAIGWFAFLGGLVVLIGIAILICSLAGLFFGIAHRR